MSCYALYEAKASFTALVHQVEVGPPIELSRHGKKVAVLVGYNEYHNLRENRKDLFSALRRYHSSIKEDVDLSMQDPFADIRARESGRSVEL